MLTKRQMWWYELLYRSSYIADSFIYVPSARIETIEYNSFKNDLA